VLARNWYKEHVKQVRESKIQEVKETPGQFKKVQIEENSDDSDDE
jgi:hypothetical protein